MFSACSSAGSLETTAASQIPHELETTLARSWATILLYSSTAPVGVFGDYAERAVLIPVGVALTARDKLVTTVNDTISTYSTSTKAQAQLRRFERRGATARNRLEREVKKARVRVERELRQRRRIVENRVNDLDDRREALARNGSDFANRVPEFAREVQDRLRRASAEGKTIFLSTHLLDMAERLCSRVGIIHRGELVAEGALDALRSSIVPGGTLEEVFLKVTEPEDAATALSAGDLA